MLDKLPLPKNLKNIPEIAGSHHETLDGKGYPRKLTGNETSLKSKMMVIADIFEALTAADRPYKPSKSLSEALKIMKNLKDNNHIDPIYTIFSSNLIYLKNTLNNTCAQSNVTFKMIFTSGERSVFGR